MKLCPDCPAVVCGYSSAPLRDFTVRFCCIKMNEVHNNNYNMLGKKIHSVLQLVKTLQARYKATDCTHKEACT